MTNFAKAKRGDLVLVKARSSCVSLSEGRHSREYWFFAAVTNVTQEGRVKGYRAHGESRPTLNVPAECVICPQEKFKGRTAAEVLAALPREYPGQHDWPKQFPTTHDAVIALLAALAA